jgi:hypothetical protein
MNSMTTPFPSAWAKLAHARSIADDLAGRVAAYRGSIPYRVIRVADTDSAEWMTYAVVERTPDPALPLVLGDCVHNLRSALDHAVFALSLQAAGRELGEREARDPAFPVCDTEAQWTTAVAKQLRFLPPALVAVIRLAQPILVPEDARANWPLRVIADLDNADKHRALLVTASVADLLGVGVSGAAEGKHRFTRPVVPGGSLVSRVPLAVDPATGTQPMWEVHVRLDPAGPVDNPILFNQEIDALLGGLIRHVEYLLGSLAASDRVKAEVSRG